MSPSFSGQPDQNISDVVSQWWRNRVQELIDGGRSDDAICLVREFGESKSDSKS